MKVIICLVLLGCIAGALCDDKIKVNKVKDPRLDLKWHAPEPKPLQDWQAQVAKPKQPWDNPAKPHGGVNLGVEKKPTFYDNGNLKIHGVAGADRNFGGPRDGAWNAKIGAGVQYSWGKPN